MQGCNVSIKDVEKEVGSEMRHLLLGDSFGSKSCLPFEKAVWLIGPFVLVLVGLSIMSGGCCGSSIAVVDKSSSSIRIHRIKCCCIPVPSTKIPFESIARVELQMFYSAPTRNAQTGQTTGGGYTYALVCVLRDGSERRLEQGSSNVGVAHRKRIAAEINVMVLGEGQGQGQIELTTVTGAAAGAVHNPIQVSVQMNPGAPTVPMTGMGMMPVTPMVQPVVVAAPSASANMNMNMKTDMDMVSSLQALAALKDAGSLTEDEYAAAKEKLLGQ
jgi:hypothetical protein